MIQACQSAKEDLSWLVSPLINDIRVLNKENLLQPLIVLLYKANNISGSIIKFDQLLTSKKCDILSWEVVPQR